LASPIDGVTHKLTDDLALALLRSADRHGTPNENGNASTPAVILTDDDPMGSDRPNTMNALSDAESCINCEGDLPPKSISFLEPVAAVTGFPLF
jgi:hypothetical protein